jgi:urease accessory protein
VIANVCGWEPATHQTQINVVFKKLYEDFVEAFDGIDNGVNAYPEDIKPRYRDSTNLASRVGYIDRVLRV